MPSSIHHPCTVRGLNQPGVHSDIERQKDLHHIAESCQQHGHTGTCYKYCKEGDQKECRFGLDESNYEPISTFDVETGELRLHCLDGLVNNFNDTLIQVIRCNMDIKFIGSGPTAKAIIYYITNYISKAQLKTHVAYAALELAIDKLGKYDPVEDLITLRAKKMLQKCAHAMIAQQELSAQQVCSYLNGFEDHYTSHQYRRLFWMNFERHVEKEFPSPECYTRDSDKDEDSPVDDPENIQIDTTDNPSINDDITIIDHYDDAPIVEDFTPADEVSIELDNDGILVQKSPYVMDYVQRGPLLDKISLWEFNAQVDKARKGKPLPQNIPDILGDIQAQQFDNNSIDSGSNSSSSTDGEADDVENADLFEADDDQLTCTSWIRPRSNLLKTHDDYLTHFHRVRQPQGRFVNVPIGIGIPRRDKSYSLS